MEQQQNHEDAGPHESSGEAGSGAGGAVSPRLNDFLAYSLAYSLSDVPHLPAISSQKAFPDLFGPHHCKTQRQSRRNELLDFTSFSLYDTIN